MTFLNVKIAETITHVSLNSRRLRGKHFILPRNHSKQLGKQPARQKSTCVFNSTFGIRHSQTDPSGYNEFPSFLYTCISFEWFSLKHGFMRTTRHIIILSRTAHSAGVERSRSFYGHFYGSARSTRNNQNASAGERGTYKYVFVRPNARPTD